MKSALFVIAFVAYTAAVPVLAADHSPAPPAGASARVRAQAPDVVSQRAVLDRYCVVCHNAKLKTANPTVP